MKNQTTSLEFSHFQVMLKSIQISSPAKGRFCELYIRRRKLFSKLLQFPKTKVIGIDRDTAVTSIANKLVKNIKIGLNFIKLNSVK